LGRSIGHEAGIHNEQQLRDRGASWPKEAGTVRTKADTAQKVAVGAAVAGVVGGALALRSRQKKRGAAQGDYLARHNVKSGKGGRFERRKG
jgi:hypothetical protein